jgi:hypothetical protein
MPLRLYVLVLDDYHAIDAPPIHSAVTFLLDHLPSQLHLVIASRADPPFPLARLRAQGQLTKPRIDDLRFTPGETAAFLNESLSPVVWRSVARQFTTGATRRDARVASAGGSLVRTQCLDDGLDEMDSTVCGKCWFHLLHLAWGEVVIEFSKR